MNYYRPPLVQLAVLDLQRVPAVPAVLSSVPAKWSPIPVVTASIVPMPLGKPEPLDLVVMQSHSGTDYHQPTSQHSDIFGSACPEYPLSQHRYPACLAPRLQQAQSP
ncbi:hypothetical protein Tco_1287404 [Tanacetum coccineum]